MVWSYNVYFLILIMVFKIRGVNLRLKEENICLRRYGVGLREK